MTTRPLYIWEKNHLDDCNSKNLFKNKNVLEVGGVIPQEYVDQLGVKSWTSIELSNKYENYANKNYKVINGSINTFDFEDESFDFVIATNSFEHIHGLDITMKRIYKLLNKGGYLSTLFGPVWSSPKGHHVYIWHNGERYTYNDNILPDWAQLLYDPDELTELLKDKYNDNTIKSIIHQIYKTNFINKLFYDDYKSLFYDSDFEVNEFRNWHESPLPDKKTLKILQDKYSKENFYGMSIKALLRKPFY